MKMLGFIMLLAGCGMIGMYGADRLRQRIVILEEIRRDMQYIYGEIEYSACDIICVLGYLGERRGYLSNFWMKISKSLSGKRRGTLEAVWKEEMVSEHAFSLLRSEELTIIRELGENIGNLDCQTQLHTIAIYQDRLNNVLESARAEYSSQAKICHVLGITAGVFLGILLI